MPSANQSKILVILHQEHSTPARIGQLLTHAGYRLDLRRPRFGDPLPATMSDHAGAIVFGGPMSANDGDEFVRREIDWIGVPLREDKPFLGVCLGAQMLAKHLGQRVYRPEDGCVEVGYYPLAAASDAAPMNEACGVGLPRYVYQWHCEGFDLPRGAAMLARGGEAFPVQMFRYANAYGTQFHPEVTYALMCRWIARGDLRLAQPNARPRETHHQGWYEHSAAVARWLDAFLAHWLGAADRLQEQRTGAGRGAFALPLAV